MTRTPRTADDHSTAGIFTTDDAAGYELDTRPARVVVFGSHLLFGSVGLNAGVPVYAESAVRCAAIPTIVLSNLPHYRSVQAIDVSAEWIAAALRDLGATGALRRVDAVAVGYLAAPEQARAIASWYRGLDPSTRPPLILDPTFGDADVGFYTNPAVAPALRDSLVPIASVLTPNLFELAHLTAGVDAVVPLDGTDADAVIRRARELLPSTDAAVVVTGVRTADHQIANLIVRATGVERVDGEEIPTSAKGLGDTFTAALVAATVDGAGLPAAVATAATRVRRAISGSDGGETTVSSPVQN